MALPFRLPRRKPAASDSTWGVGDPIPAPEAVERDGDSVWRLWEETNEQHERRFAETVPVPEDLPAGRSDVETAWANTEPAGLAEKAALEAPPVPAPTPRPVVGLEGVLRLSRRNNRVCPRPERWAAFVALLPPRETAKGLQAPPPAVTGPAWDVAPERAKRICFREQIEWAERVGRLEQVSEFLQGMEEEEWLHAGER